MNNWIGIFHRHVVVTGITLASLIPIAACTGGPHDAADGRAQSPITLPAPEWSGSTTVELVAGRHTPIGTVTAAMVAGELQVTYAVDAPWTLADSHLDVETSLRAIPQTRDHQPILHRFADHTVHAAGVRTFTYHTPVTWQPGDTLFLAAEAKAHRPDGCDDCDDDARADAVADADEAARDDHDHDHGHGDPRDHHGDTAIAWAAGTPFRHHGRAMFFTFKPTVTAVIASGNDWQLARVAGRTTDGTDKPFDDSLFMMQSATGIAQAPLPADIQADLIDPDASDPQFTVVSQTIASEIAAAERAGALTPALAAIAEPEDPAVATAPGALSPFRLFGRCGDKGISQTKNIDLGKLSIPLFSGQLGKNVTAKLALNGVTSGSATFQLNLNERRFGLFGVCIPYGIQLKDLHVFGAATLNYAATLDGTVSLSESFEKEIAKIALFDVWFAIGPIPVLVGFNLPITVGADLSVDLTGSVTYNSGQTATGTFDYTCTTSGCKGSSSFQTASSSVSQPVTGSLSARIQPSLWLEVAFRGFLYSDLIDFAQVGVQAFLDGDLWAFIGNDCGDGDGDGTNETVHGLTFDLDAEIAVNDATSFLGSDPSRHKILSLGRRHLRFFDLIGSSALSPVIGGPASATVGADTSYTVDMRPCWPYPDRVSQTIAWGDGASANVVEVPQTGAAASHAWPQPGTFALTATSFSDAHGRTWSQSTTRNITVDPVIITPPPTGTVPTTGLALWLRGDAGVTTSGGNVTAWADQSGNHRDATTSVGHAPSFVPGALGGQPVLRFFGNQLFGFADPPAPTNFTMFIVGKNAKTTGESIILGPGGNFPNNQLRWENDTQALFVGTGNGFPATTVTIGDTRVYHALSNRFDGTTFTVYRDGTSVFADPLATSGPWVLSSIGAFFSQDFMEGDLAEILIYDRPLTDTERESVNQYLRTKYNLP